MERQRSRIVFCHCGYEGCYVLNKIKVLISAIFFSKYFSSSTGSFPLNSEFANFETPCSYSYGPENKYPGGIFFDVNYLLFTRGI
jgi:hypothetical protein